MQRRPTLGGRRLGLQLSTYAAAADLQHGWQGSRVLRIAGALFLLLLVFGLYTKSSAFERQRPSEGVRFGAEDALGPATQRSTQHGHAPAQLPRRPGEPPFPWQQRLVNRTVCTDTCTDYSGNGICNDGREGRGMDVLCDLGTDCSDCGPWVHALPAGAEVAQPVAELRARGIEVYSKWTATRPPFLMAYTNPLQDVDVSGQMHHNSHIELGLTHVWYTLLSGKCMEAVREPMMPGVPEKGQRQPAEQTLRRQLVVDVGANFGYYSLYAAAHGCRVVAWEPVPQFRAFLEYGLQANNFHMLVEARGAAVADVAGAALRMEVPRRGIWGTASVGGGNIDRSIDNAGELEVLEVAGERVDSVVAEDVLLLKLDVEGYEPLAFASARGVFEAHRVGNVIMEYSPGVYEAARRWDDYHQWPGMLSYLVGKGFRLLHLRDDLVGAGMLRSDYSGALPQLEEIAAANLAHDLADAQQLRARVMGCNPPKALSARWPAHWSGCNYIPEDLNPKSFRAYFGHNTNVWATADAAGLKVGQLVGVQSMEQNSSDWYGRDPRFGLGRRECQHLQQRLQVRHRCRCSNMTLCGEEARIVEDLAVQGLLVPNMRRSAGTGAPAPP